MKALGLITEYNPFHNGHQYHIQKSKELLNTNVNVCVMSGNFLQRGLPALWDKWTRAEMALKSGVDLVIELPTYYAVNSAEYFAFYGVKILDSLHSISNISFGIEEDTLTDINNIANILTNESDNFKLELQMELAQGVSFPKAREQALVKTTKNAKYSKVLNTPNNILAIEYLKALKRLNSDIVPVGIKRFGSDYSDENITSEYCSATAIKHLLENSNNYSQDIKTLENVMPKGSYKILQKQTLDEHYPTFLDKFGKEILFSIRKMNILELQDILAVSEGLENVLKKCSYETDDIYEFINLVKSKRFTQTKIQRILIHILLSMTKSEFREIQDSSYEYIRVLGMTSKGESLLKEIAKQTNIPIITSVKKYIDEYGLNPLLAKDLLASELYCNKYNIDYKQKIIKV